MGQNPSTGRKPSNQEKRARKSAQLADARRRIAEQREREHRARRRRAVMTAAIGTVAVVALVAGLVWVVRSEDEKDAAASGAPGGGEPVVADVKPASAGAAAEKIPGMVAFTASQGHEAKREIRYEQNPPAGGEHDPAWANCGTYDKPVAARNAVHSMEHGAVWVTYRPDLPADQLAALKAKVKGKTYVILSPLDGLPTPVAASAWGLHVTLPGVDDPRLDTFLATYREGPQTPEPGAACTGGVGKPA